MIRAHSLALLMLLSVLTLAACGASGFAEAHVARVVDAAATGHVHDAAPDEPCEQDGHFGCCLLGAHCVDHAVQAALAATPVRREIAAHLNNRSSLFLSGLAPDADPPPPRR